MPEDLRKWWFDDGEGPKTYADKFTRGKEVLPGYGDVTDEGLAPEYEEEYDDSDYAARPPPFKPTVSGAEDLDLGKPRANSAPIQESSSTPVIEEALQGARLDANGGIDHEKEMQDLLNRNK